MKLTEFKKWAKSKGWQEDNYGHLHKETDGRKYRFKIGSTSVRYERQALIHDQYEWLQIASGYYKSLSITEDGKLKGLTK